ncbi:hypothetical protein DEO72_LG9g1443 [Vigna unguiculata]|uniref:Transmembrane protein n=1 Tax=Vigna unguiculata TaxID=3917 RepID=A0A4D6N0Q3_VIGUN|nr:hypothetical protein DEO72_LG9g1443 [Vigna unguiculata]
MASSGFLVLCFIAVFCAFAVPSFGRVIPTDTVKNIVLVSKIEQTNHWLDKEPRIMPPSQPSVKFSENSRVMVEDIHVDYSGHHTHPCPPDHCR